MDRVWLTLGLLIPLVAAMGVYAEEEPVLRIHGLVDEPLNISYSEFLRLPMVSINASVVCVGSPPEDIGVNSYVVYTFNWTGVKVSDLLDMVGVGEGAVDVVFSDGRGYSSSLPVEVVREEEILLAVFADGETLDYNQGYPFREVVPCWWGYKWVKYVEEVEVVGYNHKGFWESRRYPDNARIPDCEYIAENPKVVNPLSTALATLGSLCILASIYTQARAR
jgi:DMSO/TMAO reductase YedYZ molybdopterin-dependent catalytic subunit